MKKILTLQKNFRRFQPEIAVIAGWLFMLSMLAGILLTREVTY